MQVKAFPLLPLIGGIEKKGGAAWAAQETGRKGIGRPPAHAGSDVAGENAPPAIDHKQMILTRTGGKR